MKSKPEEKNKKATNHPTQHHWHEMNRKQRRETMRKIQSEELSLEVIHPHAAGIFGIRSTSKNTWNEIMRCLRSWLQSVSQIRSFHCHHSESESQFTWAARLPVKSALP